LKQLENKVDSLSAELAESKNLVAALRIENEEAKVIIEFILD